LSIVPQPYWSEIYLKSIKVLVAGPEISTESPAGRALRSDVTTSGDTLAIEYILE
jgi:hypothetical protein